MQATLDGSVLKPFTRALTCLSRYGEELSIFATPDDLSLSATNSSKSAYCRFKYDRQFFSKYNVGPKVWTDEVQEVITLSGQLLTKSLLSILKHKTVEKSVERCELSIVDGDSGDNTVEDDEENDTLESRLIVRLHCKHGVVKTHRLKLSIPDTLLEPTMPDTTSESKLSIGPRAIKDIIDHFPNKGPKADPQLIWNFGESEVEVKSVEGSLDMKGAQLSTELTIQAEEFDEYDLYAAPTVIVFHLREFNATIAFAESMSLSVELRFTEATAPLFIHADADSSNSLFVISTSEAANPPASGSQVILNPRKRSREGDEGAGVGRRKSMKVVQETEVLAARASVARSSRSSLPRPSFEAATPAAPNRSQREEPGGEEDQLPLFLPGSQFSAGGADLQLEFDPEPGGAAEFVADDQDDDMALVELPATQSQTSSKSKGFHPLFDD